MPPPVGRGGCHPLWGDVHPRPRAPQGTPCPPGVLTATHGRSQRHPGARMTASSGTPGTSSPRLWHPGTSPGARVTAAGHPGAHQRASVTRAHVTAAGHPGQVSGAPLAPGPRLTARWAPGHVTAASGHRRACHSASGTTGHVTAAAGTTAPAPPRVRRRPGALTGVREGVTTRMVVTPSRGVLVSGGSGATGRPAARLCDAASARRYGPSSSVSVVPGGARPAVRRRPPAAARPVWAPCASRSRREPRSPA